MMTPMSKLFVDNLNMRKRNSYRGVGSGGYGMQTGKIMIEFERVRQESNPDIAGVVGDVNSTIACGLVAVNMNVRLAHVEAGLRSYDRTMWDFTDTHDRCEPWHSLRSWGKGRLPELWDGHVAERIVRILLQKRTGFDT